MYKPAEILRENETAAVFEVIDDYLFVATAINEAELEVAKDALSAEIGDQWQKSGVIILSQEFALNKRGRVPDALLNKGITTACSEHKDLAVGKKQFIDGYHRARAFFFQPKRNNSSSKRQEKKQNVRSDRAQAGSHPIAP